MRAIERNVERLFLSTKFVSDGDGTIVLQYYVFRLSYHIDRILFAKEEILFARDERFIPFRIAERNAEHIGEPADDIDVYRSACRSIPFEQRNSDLLFGIGNGHNGNNALVAHTNIVGRWSIAETRLLHRTVISHEEGDKLIGISCIDSDFIVNGDGIFYLLRRGASLREEEKARRSAREHRREQEYGQCNFYGIFHSSASP